MQPEDQFSAVRTALLNETNWLVRGDIARLLGRRRAPDVWPVLFDSYERWPNNPRYEQMLGEVFSTRYRLDPTGYIAAARNRNAETRLFALERISESPHISDMSALMDISEGDSDSAVRERAMVLLGKLLNR
jgi:hypothetical protein